MKKILFIDVNYKNGSTGRIVYNLHKEASKNGFDSYVAYGRGNKIKEKNIFKFGLDFETKVHVVLNRLTGIHGSFSILSTIRLINYIKKIQPDIIHIHELHGYFVNIIMLMEYIKKNNIRTIWTFHCEYMYEGKGNVYSKKENPNWNVNKDYPRSLFFNLTSFTKNRYKKSFSNFNFLTIIAPSEWLKNRINDSFLRNKDVRVINNGIDQTVFKKIEYNDILDKYNLYNKNVVLSVAPNIMSYHKGGNEILKVSDELIHEDLFFVIVGSKSNRIISKDNILILPKTQNQSELVKLYNLSKLFLITSIRENYPTTALESLSCGTPIVGYHTGGTKETTNSITGKFVNYGDYKKLAKVVKDNIEFKKENEEYILDYSKRHSDDVMAKKYFELYKEKL